MGKYGEAAVLATDLVTRGRCSSPVEGWTLATRAVFQGKQAAQNKGCPRCAYLGLCEEGLVRGVPVGTYTKSRDNKRYAVEAVRLLQRQPELSRDPRELWRSVVGGDKKENSQMDVVLALWNRGLIVGLSRP
jgi:hypothetical protein